MAKKTKMIKGVCPICCRGIHRGGHHVIGGPWYHKNCWRRHLSRKTRRPGRIPIGIRR